MTLGRFIRAAAAAGVLVAVAGLGTSAHAQLAVPAQLSDQGRLFDATGTTPVTGSHTFKFSIYSAATGGTALWTITAPMAVANGYFATVLDGSTAGGNAFPAGMFNGQQLYLGITVDLDAEMSPRDPMGSVPYAIAADNAIGNITPKSVTVAGVPVISNTGTVVGPVSSTTALNTTGGLTVSGTPVINASGAWVNPITPDPVGVYDNNGSIGTTVPGHGFSVACSGPAGFLDSCSTPVFTAGANETAFIFSQASCSVPMGDGLGVSVGESDNGAGIGYVGMSLADNEGSTTAGITGTGFRVAALTAGHTYVFSTGLTDSAGCNTYPAVSPGLCFLGKCPACYCHTTVEVVKTQ